MESQTREQLCRLIERVRPLAEGTAVIAVINMKSRTPQRPDYSYHSMRTSFLADFEVDAIVSALRESGFYVDHFSDEDDFFRWVLADNHRKLGLPRNVVYTSALNGVGPGRRTLVPAFCSHQGLLTANSDAYSCAIGRHKFHLTRLAAAFGIRTPATWYFDPRSGWWDGESPPAGTPVIAKATYEGSSIGVSHETTGPFNSELEERIRAAARGLAQPMTVQELIAGNEIEVPVLRLDAHKALGVAVLSLDDQTSLDSRVLTYQEGWDDRYGYAEAECIPEETRRQAMKVAERVASILNFYGFCRVDFRVDKTGQTYLIDVASTPHLTESNAVAHVLRLGGFSYADLWLAAVGAAFLRHGQLSLI